MKTHNANIPHHADLDLFKQIRSREGDGVFASNGPNYYAAVFGRDSIEVAEDLLPVDNKLPREIILTMCRLQGSKYDAITEEEPGRIHHEHRSLDYNDGDLPQVSIDIMQELSEKWGGDENEMTYYGSVDATPLFVRLIANYVHHYGHDILDLPIHHPEVESDRTVRDCLTDATDWILRKMDDSDIGLIEYKRSNPRGIGNQVWKDSETSYVFKDGTFANVDNGIAACEVQAYAFDALLGASALTKDDGRKFKLHQAAHRLQDQTIKHMWNPEEKLFAMGVAFDDEHNPLPIDTPSSNAGLMLDSEILATESVDPEIAKAIARLILSSDFLTPAGVRCRSLQYADVIDFPDYHGSYAVWAKETSDVARGLIRHGYIEEGEDIMFNMIKTLEEFGNFYEFFYVDAEGIVIHPEDMEEAYRLNGDQAVHQRMNIPEPGQAWSMSAYIQAMCVLNPERIDTLSKATVDAPAA